MGCWSWWFLLLSFLSISLTPTLSSSSISDLFETWCIEHGKTYDSDGERLYRLKVFEDNYAYVMSHNSVDNNSSYTLSLNAFSDLTHHEFKASRLGLSSAAAERLRKRKRNVNDQPYIEEVNGDIPSAVDWRKNGAVVGVKDQGSCGACWAFSTTGAIEGINKIVTGSLISLSEQELIDCDKSYNSGCEGGLMDYAFEFVINNHGIDTEDDYPFQAADKSCSKDKLKRHVVTINDYTDVPQNNEKLLLQAVAKQPVSVGICGSERAFQLYSNGIFSGPCSTSLDHAVLIVGFDSKDGIDYWIIKNSWGSRWGINGYMHMQRNTGNSQGICGINMLASYPIKTSPNPPPPPPPGPIKCDLFSTCPSGQTCCCGSRILGICFSWKCCNLDSAVCCKDNQHCCPHDYPICDVKKQQCLKKNGNGTLVKMLEKKGDVSSNWISTLEDWNL